MYYCPTDSRYFDKPLTIIEEFVPLHYIENIDTMDPVLKLSKSIDSKAFNYVYLQDTNKYYYVTKPPEFKEGFYTISLHEDVLKTWAKEIKECDAIIERNEYNFNLYQNDPKMKLYSYESVRTVQFPAGFNFNTQNFVMGVVGSQIFED